MSDERWIKLTDEQDAELEAIVEAHDFNTYELIPLAEIGVAFKEAANQEVRTIRWCKTHDEPLYQDEAEGYSGCVVVEATFIIPRTPVATT